MITIQMQSGKIKAQSESEDILWLKQNLLDSLRSTEESLSRTGLRQKLV